MEIDEVRDEVREEKRRTVHHEGRRRIDAVCDDEA